MALPEQSKALNTTPALVVCLPRRAELFRLLVGALKQNDPTGARTFQQAHKLSLVFDPVGQSSNLISAKNFGHWRAPDDQTLCRKKDGKFAVVVQELKVGLLFKAVQV